MGYLVLLKGLLASVQVVPANAEKGVIMSGEKDKEILQTFLLSGEVEVETMSSTTQKPKTKLKQHKISEEKKKREKKEVILLGQYNLF